LLTYVSELSKVGAPSLRISFPRMSTPYRAVYWRSADRQATVRLTGKDQAELSNSELLAQAAAEARANEIDMDGGQIVIEHEPESE
jgi:hypothetical protein